MKAQVALFYYSTKLLNSSFGRILQGMLFKWRLSKLFRFIRQHSPFYKDFTSLSRAPVMNKKLMMENFDLINTVGLKKDRVFDFYQKSEETGILPVLNDITIGMSTGTSGSRGLFLASQRERARWAGVILAKLLPKSLLSKQSIALFLRANSKLYETLNSNTIEFCYYSLSKEWNENVRILNNQNPDVLVAPPSVLRMLAEELVEGRLKIQPLKVISGAEVLTDDARREIEDAFKIKLHQVYQCTEGFLGATCKEGQLHLNEDFIHFEKKWIEKETRRFSPLITDTLRTSQPTINYLLDDILVMAENQYCPCGSKHLIIESIEGRCDDIFVFGKKRIFPDYLRRTIVKATDKIEDYKLVQMTENILILSINPSDSIEAQKVQTALLSYFSSQGIEHVEVRVEDFKRRNPGDKLRRIQSALMSD